MLCLTPIYWDSCFSPKGVFSKSGLNPGQDQVAEPINLCTVAGVDDGGRIDLLNDCRSCQDAAGTQAITLPVHLIQSPRAAANHPRSALEE